MSRRVKVTHTGVYVDAKSKHHAVIDAARPDGRHFWIVASVFRVINPAATQQFMDRENLLTIEGPACWWCERQWTPTIGSKCPGAASPIDAPPLGDERP